MKARVNKTTEIEEQGSAERVEEFCEGRRLASYGGLFLIPLPGFIRARRHSSLITGCHGGYVAASSPPALFHSETCWDLNGMIHSARDRRAGREKERETVAQTEKDRRTL